MKKVFVLLAVALAIISTTTMAQGGGNFNPTAMKERQLKMLKESDLKLTDVQADSVVAVQVDLMQQKKGMRDLAPEDRKAKMKEINDAMEKRLALALKDETLAKKVIAYQKVQQKKMRQQGSSERP